jgi:hypothetical protein
MLHEQVKLTDKYVLSIEIKYIDGNICKSNYSFCSINNAAK